jgi:hypothetical protein
MTALDAARGILGRDIQPVPVPHKSKAPVLKGWTALTITADTLGDYFNGAPQNVGMLNGAASGNLATVDLDTREAHRAAAGFLPETGLKSGRAKRPASHWHYRADMPVKTIRFDDPLLSSDKPGHRLLELLGAGSQVVVYGTHPSGDTYRFDDDGEPALITTAALRRACALTATAALLARYWPGEGVRHETALAAGGWLVRGGLTGEEAADIIGMAATIASDDEAEKRRADVLYTMRRLAAGDDATGRPTLVKYIDAAIITTIEGWLSLHKTTAAPAGAAPDDDQAAPRPILKRIADIPRTGVDWLVEPYIPRGRVTIIEGNPGTKKTWVSLALATAVAAGGSIGGAYPAASGPVLLLQDEDGYGDTVRPRLESMGADLTRIVALTGVLQNNAESPLTLDEAGLQALEAALVDLQPALVIIDPLFSYLGGRVDLHRANEVRAIMRPLAALAEKYNVAIICIRHLTKGGRDAAAYRGLGSIDFTAIARSVLLVGEDPDDPSRSIVVPTKANLTERGPALAFAIEAGRFVWLGESTVTASQLLSPEEDGCPRGEAERFLRELLQDGPIAAKDALSEARDAGIAERTLKRARTTLGVVATRENAPGRERGAGRWVWALPAASGPVEGPEDITRGPRRNDVRETKEANSSKGEKVAPLNGFTPTHTPNRGPLERPTVQEGHPGPLVTNVQEGHSSTLRDRGPLESRLRCWRRDCGQLATHHSVGQPTCSAHASVDATPIDDAWIELGADDEGLTQA